MSILLIGASGFLGKAIAVRLIDTGHDLVCGVRKLPLARERARCGYMQVDLAHERDPSVWLPRLDGVDTVINAAGIIKQSAAQSFDAVHCAGPRALFQACAEVGISRVLQISALGADAAASSEFHRSKHRADTYLRGLQLSSVVVQPSLVYGNEGESSQTLRVVASLPIIALPGRGQQMIQPVHVDDVVSAVVALVRSDIRGTLPLVGPQALTLKAYLEGLRAAMGIGKPLFVFVPVRMAALLSHFGGRQTRWPDTEMLRMLERGNTADAAPIHSLLGHAPRTVATFIPAHVAKAIRLASRMVWLGFLLRIGIATVWIAAGLVSLGLYPVRESYELLTHAGIPASLAPVMLYGGAAIDLTLGIATLLPRRRPKLWAAQAVVISVYSLIIAFTLPEFWLHPFGPLLKNLPLLVATAIMYEIDRP
jgi:uncharacterized protein YbjT (DUF2867 family)